MAISFPSSPTTNQTYTYGNNTWSWDGSEWALVRSAASPTGPTGPTGPQGATGPTGSTPTTANTATSATTANGLGFIGIPQDAQSGSTYTTTYADEGSHIYLTNAAPTVTIPSNSSVAYPLGTVITFIASSSTTASVTCSDTMYLAGVGTTGARTLAPYGIATAIKVASTTWFISGNGLS